MHRQVENRSTPVARLIFILGIINLATAISLNMPMIFYPSLYNDLSLHVGMDCTVIAKGATVAKSVTEGVSDR